MTATLHICARCKRHFDAAGAVVALSVPEQFAAFREGRISPETFVCATADCGEVAAEIEARERAQVRRATERHHQHQHHRKAESKRTSCQPSTTSPARVAHEPARMPYKDAEVAEEAVARPGNGGKVMEPAMSQSQFVASGQADSQNAKLLEFFSLPHNFNKWFKSTFLEELSGATRMNNRAIDLRPVFIERGHYIDNCMMTDTHTDRKASYYRVCNIEHAVSLSAEQKTKLLGSVTWRDAQ